MKKQLIQVLIDDIIKVVEVDSVETFKNYDDMPVTFAYRKDKRLSDGVKIYRLVNIKNYGAIFIKD
jgi:hypothetical protein